MQTLMRLDQLAINTVSIKQAAFEEAVAAVAAAGFRHVEFRLSLVKEWLEDGHTVKQARHLLNELQLTSIGGFERAVECFAEPAAVRASLDFHLQNAALIHALGGGTMVVGTDGPDTPGLDALDTVARTFQKLARSIEGLNVNVALEFNWGPLVKSLNSAVLVCEKVNHPQLGVLFDPAHYYTTTTKFDDINDRSGRWINHVHLNDMANKPGDLSNCNSDRVLPGDGILDLPALIGALESNGYHGYFSMELFNEGLWQLPAHEAARLTYESASKLCT
jgi:4-hydroxyphenylpyruvate dioxygenase